ncbi:MAG: motility protein A [Lachnospiraceae bacterium]|jgi:chemotaxis protein MotA|nr:motility protein A [Lachnospiraceae bacterium]
MDLSTIVGIVAGFIIIILGIGFDKVGNFIDPGSVFLTIGGMICGVVASFPFSELKKMGSHMKILTQGKRYNYQALIEQLVEMAQLARQNGLLSLEEKANEIDDLFFKQGLMLVVDATEEDEIRSRLENELDAISDRHDSSVAIYEKAASYAPAFGMIGTLVGLVNMLKSMDLDSGGASSLGADMSVALVTTFYGCILANLIFSPMAKKLRIRNDEEMRYRQIMVEGIMSIQAGDNPKFLKEKLASYLDQKTQMRILNSDGEGGGDEGGGKKKKKSKE